MRSIRILSVAAPLIAVKSLRAQGTVSKGANIMNQFTNKPEITLTSALKASLRNRLSRAALAFLGLLILVSTATVPAKAAGCGGPGGRDNVVKYPMAETKGAIGPDTIVGLWHVTYTTSSNAPFAVSLKEWHSDGTEIMNSGGRNPNTGAFCLGVWEKVGSQYKLNHFAAA